MRRTRTVGFLAAAAAVALGLAGTPGAASADPADNAPAKAAVSRAWTELDKAPVPGGFSSWAEVMKMQQRLNAAATRIQEAARALPDSGYASTVAAPENRELVVYWRGKVPASVRRVIAQQSRDVPVRVIPARYSEAEMLTEVRRLSSDPAYAQVIPMVDGSGIRVKQAAGRSARLATQASKVAVIAEGTTAGDGILFTRQNDSSPYWGGARTQNCTTGFAIWWNGNSRILSAGHCGNNGDYIYDGGGDFMGTVINDNDTRDTHMIDVRGHGRVWDGPWTETSYTKAVRGATFSNVGNWLCTSGSRSGVRCNIRVTANNASWGGRFPMVYADQIDRLSAAGQGDSGGPVFELPSPDDGRVIAKGTITGGVDGTFVACTGEVWAGRVCSWRFVYADVTQSLAFYGASILTSS
ncbi:hypothetical protein ABZ570_15700 [Micromonospora sp. NPDC007271]|uniref:hypothetical protein n=1 Tax=Micromonospora sp. NPDC007271 TaxID=3154587 RepID=UPI0033D80577